MKAFSKKLFFILKKIKIIHENSFSYLFLIIFVIFSNSFCIFYKTTENISILFLIFHFLNYAFEKLFFKTVDENSLTGSFFVFAKQKIIILKLFETNPILGLIFGYIFYDFANHVTLRTPVKWHLLALKI